MCNVYSRKCLACTCYIFSYSYYLHYYAPRGKYDGNYVVTSTRV